MRGGRLWAALAAAAAVAGSTGTAGAQVDLIGPIRSAQEALVQRAHRAPIGLAELAVSDARTALAADSRALSAARTAASAAGARLRAARSRLAADQSSLGAVTAALAADAGRVARDRAGMGVIAVALYTGETTSLQPATLHALETDQKAVIEAGEVEAVASVLGRTLRSDLHAAEKATRRRTRLLGTVAGDGRAVRAAASVANRLSGRASLGEVTVAADSQRLAAGEARLATAEESLRADLASVAGPPAKGMSILGGSALTPRQLAGWYRSQGYADLTSAPVLQLATWYVKAGDAEGVRGDVAFAQAVLETGGFSSPDAVNLSNFAGIGHCDSCPSGWAFPSPRAGVVGQLQLLRIWSGAGTAPGGPGPVLAALTPSAQKESGCCATWESLTGVWATDPYYGAEILGIYQQILGWALSG